MDNAVGTLSFEAALERLEATVKRLEGDQISLDESLSLFEEGVRLSQGCAAQLERAEQRVLALVESRGGDLELSPFDGAER